MRRSTTIDRMNMRVTQLVSNFGSYVGRFNSENLFTGPSQYFHFRTLEVLRECGGAAAAAKNRTYAELLYATLTAWGMHRMGPAGAKLVEFNEFSNGLASTSHQLKHLESTSIVDLRTNEVGEVARALWNIAESFRVSASETRIVAASKTLHHLLPALVPPVDREYTLQFFYQNKLIPNTKNATVFQELLPKFHFIATSCWDQILDFRGVGMNSSPTKTIDNAIVGYVRTHLKPAAGRAEGMPR